MKTLLFLLAIVCILMGGLSFYLVQHVLTPTHNGKYNNEQPDLGEWGNALKAQHILRDTFITNKEGIRLHAFYAATENAQGTAVVVHGYTSNARGMFPIAAGYRDLLHYNILMPDLQNHGFSEGESIQMGWKDRLDVMQWCEVAHQLFEPELPMVLHGVSMGGATIMMLSGETLPDYIQAFVNDCGYTSVWDQIAAVMKHDYRLPAFPIIPIASRICEWKYKWNFAEASALIQVGKCDRPILFIHGDADHYVPTEMVHRLYANKKKGEKALWLAPETGHAKAFDNHPEEYFRQIQAFLQRTVHTKNE